MEAPVGTWQGLSLLVCRIGVKTERGVLLSSRQRRVFALRCISAPWHFHLLRSFAHTRDIPILLYLWATTTIGEELVVKRPACIGAHSTSTATGRQCDR